MHIQMRNGFFVFAILIFQLSVVGQQSVSGAAKKDLNYFLRDLYDVASLPSYNANSYSAEVSTYDRTGLNNDGFNGTYSYIRKNEDSSLVIFDVKGPGVINRFWTPTPTNDSLDFFIDNLQKPRFTICYRDLFSGRQYPFIAPLCANQLGGYYCYLPIPFARFCKIVFRGNLTRFHQIGYRLFPAGTAVESFSLPLNKESELALNKIKEQWSEPVPSVKMVNSSEVSYATVDHRFVLKPGSQVLAFSSKVPGRILGFELSTAEALDSLAKNIDIKITWDDEKTAAVYCPLADYFGYAFGKPSMKSILAGSYGSRNYSYMPMPFDVTAKIELIYRAPTTESRGKPVTLLCRVFLGNKKRNASTEGKFYANWNRENPVPNLHPFTMLNIKGRGHFVGTSLQAQGLHPGMTIFFEGDDSTVVDGELRMHGTGSEDFFNGGWYALLDCWDAPMSLPLSGALAYSIPMARTGGYRFFMGDKISFEKSLFQSIEHGGEHNSVAADYTSVSYYYCSQANPQKMIPNSANTKMFLTDTLILYPQLLNMGLEGSADISTRWAFPTGGLSFYYTISDDTRMRWSLSEIPPGNYRVFLDYVKTPGGAMFSLWQRQSPLTEWVDTQAGAVERVALQEMCDIALTPLNNTLSFQFKTKADQRQMILNRMVLVRK